MVCMLNLSAILVEAAMFFLTSFPHNNSLTEDLGKTLLVSTHNGLLANSLYGH